MFMASIFLQHWPKLSVGLSNPSTRSRARPAGRSAPSTPSSSSTRSTIPPLLRRWRGPTLRVPDGAGILWAARRQGVALSERVTGSDGIYRICEEAAHKGWRVYFLGAGPGVAAETARRLVARYPGLQVAGTHSGSPAAEDWPEIHARLAAARPDILFVAFGHPKQDLWIDAHRGELPVGVAMGVGGAFDFVAGITRRAPLAMQRFHLEWLHRLIMEPWRWRRMMKLPIFVGLVLGDRVGN